MKAELGTADRRGSCVITRRHDGGACRRDVGLCCAMLVVSVEKAEWIK